MSQATPSKHDRFERHYSRQRGAGVRTLASSFGFSFAAVVATPIVQPGLEEPPPKRQRAEDVRTDAPRPRRDNRVGEAIIPDLSFLKTESFDEHQSETVLQQPLPDVNGDFKVKKVRNAKNSPVMPCERVEYDGSIQNEGCATEIHPSKPGNKKSRRCITAKATSAPPKSEANLAALVVAVRRPRRRAADDAIAKVTQGFVEEAAPIDQKRRNPEPERKKPRGNPKRSGTSERSAVKLLPLEGVEDVKCTSPVEVLPQRMRRKQNTVSEKTAITKVGSDEKICTERIINRGSERLDLKSSGWPREVDNDRRPLAETNSNTTMQSMSPDKHKKPSHTSMATHASAREVPRAESPAWSEVIASSPVRTRGRKLRITRDQAPRLPSIRHDVACSVHSVKQSTSELNAERETSERAPAPVKSSRKRRNIQHRSGHNGVATSARRDVGVTTSDQQLHEAQLLPDIAVVNANLACAKTEAHASNSRIGAGAGKSSHKRRLEQSNMTCSDIKQAERSISSFHDKAGGASSGSNTAEHAHGFHGSTSALLSAASIPTRAKQSQLQRQEKHPTDDCPAAVDEDVDWLFETGVATILPKRPMTRAVRRVQDQDMGVKEMDLDDVLSNIATLVRMQDATAGLVHGAKKRRG